MPNLLAIESGRVANVATFYKASGLLGTGRYSEVYKAFDTHSQTDVALKIYTGHDSAAHARAQNEAALLAKLSCLNSEYFPVIRRSGKFRIKNNNHPLLVLELGAHVSDDGQKRVISLKDILSPVDSELAAIMIAEDFWNIHSLFRWMLHLIQAVKQLHSIGVVHRDIKPGNILMKKGPGQSQPVPFVLDYNSASDARESDSGSGTPRYLPPEVRVGLRISPSPDDDLWAVAKVGWEMLFGPSATHENPNQPVSLLKGGVPESLIACLSRALNVDAELRFRSADEFGVALEACVPIEASEPHTLRYDDVARARAEMGRIRQLIGQVYAPPGQITVPKDIDDAVNTVFAWLSHDDSQALNLVADLVKLGPAAIPACLQQGYRLHAKVASYDDVIVALGQLAAIDRDLAENSLDTYALSSNRGVRDLCWRVCESLRYFPENFLGNLTKDEGLLLPEERLRLADLCIRFSGEPTAAPALVKYMCREYVLDTSRYHDIRSKIADRMYQLQGDRTAQAIWHLCRAKVWDELPDFRQLSESAKAHIEGGLIELLSDAFAATADAGLRVLKASKSQWHTDAPGSKIFRRFAVKAGRKNDEVRAWLVSEASRTPGDKVLKRIAQDLTQQPRQDGDNPPALLRDYLSGDKTLFNELRFSKDERLFTYLDAELSELCSRVGLDRILDLLRGFEHRHRGLVIKLMLQHWQKLSEHRYESAAEILTSSVPSSLRDRVARVLDHDLGGVHDEVARRALDDVLR